MGTLFMAAYKKLQISYSYFSNIITIEKIVPEPFVEHPKSGVFHVTGSGLAIKLISRYLFLELVSLKIG